MKKIILVFVSLAFILQAHSQVFNTGQTLKQGTFSLGVEPALHIDGGANGFILFVHGGYGIKSGMDLGLKFGLGNPNYFGADLEFALGNRVSLAVGAHDFGNFGLDGTLNFVIPIKSDIRLFTGLDADINFVETVDNQGDEKTEIDVPFWIPIGLEVGMSSNMNLIFESEIGLNGGYHVIGGGLSFYF
jgi:hypothetical protein